MSREVEVSLRVPNMKVRASIPKPEETLELTTRSGTTLPARVVRADWIESRELFVLSCQYANRSITAEEYAALSDDPEWELKPLI
jgi:hypothetical protein